MTGFNPEEIARAREGEDIQIGDQSFVQLRRVPKVMRAYRGIVREDEGLARKQDRLARKIADLDDDATDYEESYAPLEQERIKLDDAREEAIYKLALCLLGPNGDGEKPTMKHLQDHLDLVDCGQLLDRLTPGVTEQQDPTPAASEATGS